MPRDNEGASGQRGRLGAVAFGSPTFPSIPKRHRPQLGRDALLDRAGHQIERLDEVLHRSKLFLAARDADGALRSLSQLGRMAHEVRLTLRRACDG